MWCVVVVCHCGLRQRNCRVWLDISTTISGETLRRIVRKGKKTGCVKGSTLAEGMFLHGLLKLKASLIIVCEYFWQVLKYSAVERVLCESVLQWNHSDWNYLRLHLQAIVKQTLCFGVVGFKLQRHACSHNCSVRHHNMTDKKLANTPCHSEGGCVWRCGPHYPSPWPWLQMHLPTNWAPLTRCIVIHRLSGFTFTASQQHPRLPLESRMLIRSREGKPRHCGEEQSVANQSPVRYAKRHESRTNLWWFDQWGMSLRTALNETLVTSTAP